ncbi:MAG: phosphatase PAP2 family protein [Mycobacterium leprae]
MKKTLERVAVILLALASFVLIVEISKVEAWDALLWAVLMFICLDVEKDRTELSWLKFLPLGLILMAVPYYIYKDAANYWWKIADWQMTSVRHIWNWDHFFAAIPLNNPQWIRQIYSAAWLDKRLAWVYNYGFAFTIWAAVIRSFLARDPKKMARYTLASHLLQTPLIIPFYNTIELHEVWWVMKWPDLLGRDKWMDLYHLKLNAQNCFPSMHTSIAFAVLLLAQREKGPLFRWGMTLYAAAVIFSTLYLQIHWVIDVLAGLLFGYLVVKLTDYLLDGIRWQQLFRRKKQIQVERGVAAQ